MAKTQFRKWAKIPRFSNVDPRHRGRRPYDAKVKLDGTNAAIGRTRGGVLFCQSRSRVITPDDDNYGFARWVMDQADAFEFITKGDTWYGEWAGPGIQKRTAVSKIPTRMWFPFARVDQHGSVYTDLAAEWSSAFVEDAHLIPFAAEGMILDWDDASADRVNQMIEACEDCDPLVKALFDVEGLGEGFVFTPTTARRGLMVETFAEQAFKAKGLKHEVVKVKKPATVDPETAADAEAFVDMVLTEARLEQGLEAVGGVKDRRKTGDFLKWVGQDVQTETGPEMEASGLAWKDVSKPLAFRARSWWFS